MVDGARESQGERPDQGFTKADRVVKQYDFDRVHQGDWFSADKYLVVKAARNKFEYSRLGLSISRRVGNAVVRNRWKRALREAFRLNRNDLPTGWDLVVRPRKGARLDASKLARSLINLTRRIDSNFQRQQK